MSVQAFCFDLVEIKGLFGKNKNGRKGRKLQFSVFPLHFSRHPNNTMNDNMEGDVLLKETIWWLCSENNLTSTNLISGSSPPEENTESHAIKKGLQRMILYARQQPVTSETKNTKTAFGYTKCI